MNAIYFTQSSSLDVFYQLYLRTREKLGLEKVGFYVANLSHYENFITKVPDFEKKFLVVKEWEIYEAAAISSKGPDISRITEYENEIGDPNLWTPLVTDRRLYMGSKATFRQDYAPAFSRDAALSVLDQALVSIDKLFKDISPDFICTLYTATFGDCLGHMFAKARGIRSLDLRLSRLKNNVMFVDGIEEPPRHVQKLFGSYAESVPADLVMEAEAYINSVRADNAMYEGVVPSAGRKRDTRGVESQKIIVGLKKFLGNYIRSRKRPYCFDYQVPDPFMQGIYRHVINPINRKLLSKSLSGRLVRENDLAGTNYILYPLHTEPELVLAQFARPYLNQIEVIRNISLSIPVGMTLLVKEHPMMLGRRSRKYYKKILDIPNVLLVEMSVPSEKVLEHAKLVVVLRGAIGLESVIRQKPVVSLGKSMFELMAGSMFRQCKSLYDLSGDIDYMLEHYCYDHKNLVRYLSAVLAGSAAVNLVTDLLGKSGRFRADVNNATASFESHPHLDVLAEYLVDRLRS